MAEELEIIESQIVTSEAVSPLTRAEIDCQIATAKRYPRSINKFKQDAKSMATLDEATAISCIYSLPRGNKPITGPSVRLSEIIASAWGNLRVGARVVDEGPKFITAQGFAHDLERNVAITMEVQRRITNKNGGRYSDDMIVMTGNASAAIAFRNAVLKCVPKAYWQEVEQAARETALGKQETLGKRRASAIEYATKLGVITERILSTLEVASVEDIGLEKLAALKALFMAVKNNDRSIDDAFPAAKAKISQDATPVTGFKKSEDLPPDGEPSNGDKKSGNAESPKEEAPAKATTAEIVSQFDPEEEFQHWSGAISEVIDLTEWDDIHDAVKSACLQLPESIGVKLKDLLRKKRSALQTVKAPKATPAKTEQPELGDESF